MYACKKTNLSLNSSNINISGTSYFGESHDPVLKRFWKESLSKAFIKNLNTKFRKAALKKLNESERSVIFSYLLLVVFSYCNFKNFLRNIHHIPIAT